MIGSSGLVGSPASVRAFHDSMSTWPSQSPYVHGKGASVDRPFSNTPFVCPSANSPVT